MWRDKAKYCVDYLFTIGIQAYAGIYKSSLVLGTHHVFAQVERRGPSRSGEEKSMDPKDTKGARSFLCSLSAAPGLGSHGMATARRSLCFYNMPTVTTESRLNAQLRL